MDILKNMNITISSVLILSLSSILITIFNNGQSHIDYLYILPTTVLLLTLSLYKVYINLSKSLVFNLFIFQVCIRYCVLPILISTGAELIGLSSFYLQWGVAVMIIEALACYIVLIIIHTKQKNTYDKYKNNLIVPLANSNNLLLLIIFIFIALYSLDAFSNINTIWSLNEYVDDSTSSSASIFVGPFRALCAIYLINLIYKTSKIKTNLKIWFYLSIVIVSSLFVMGVSRLSTVFYMIPVIYLVTRVISNHDSKKLMIASMGILIASVALSSISKFSRNDSDISLHSLITAKSINAYFSGPGNIAIGFDALEHLNLKLTDHLLFLFNDSLQNVVLLSKLTNDSFKTNSTYNLMVYGHTDYADQIVPLATSGLFHFGIVGIFFYSSLILYLAFFFERKSYTSNYLITKYPFIILSTSFSLVFMMSLSSFYSTIISIFLFYYIPFHLIKNIKLKR